MLRAITASRAPPPGRRSGRPKPCSLCASEPGRTAPAGGIQRLAPGASSPTKRPRDARSVKQRRLPQKWRATEIGQLETLEFYLFGLVLVVLALEGFFVISPAVVKIQAFMEELAGRTKPSRPMPRSWSGATGNSRILHPSRRMTSRSRYGGPGFQRPLEVKHAAALGDQGRDYVTGSRTPRVGCRP